MVSRTRGEVLMGHSATRDRCPIGLRVCSLCYWRRGQDCMFPAGGYDECGFPEKKQLSDPVT